MNKLFSRILFIFILLLSSLSLVSATIEDDFNRTDSGTLGTATNGNVWAEDLDSGFQFQIKNDNFYYNETGDGTNYNNLASLQLSASNPSRIDIYNFNIGQSDSGNVYPYILLGNSGTETTITAAITVFPYRSGSSAMAYYTSGWFSATYVYSLETTIDISFRNINYVSDTFDIYVDDVLQKSGATFQTNENIDYINLLWASSGTDVLAGKIDCIATNGDTCGGVPVTSITFNNPTQGQYLNDTSFLLNVSFSEITNSTYSLNGASNVTLGTDENESIANLTGIEGLNTIQIFTNTSGTLNNASINFTIDTIDPIITETLPSEINNYNINFSSYITINETNPYTCVVEVVGQSNTTCSSTSYTFSTNGNKTINIYVNDSAGNIANSLNHIILVNPINYFYFYNGSGYVSNFTFGGRSDNNLGYVNYTHYNDGLIIGNNTLLFEKLGYVSENFSFVLNSTNQLNQTFNISPAEIIVNLYDRATGAVFNISANVIIYGLGNITTATGQAVFQDFNFVPGDYLAEASSTGYYTEQNTFTYSGESNAVINLYLLSNSLNSSSTLVVPTTDEWDNVLAGVDVRLQEYDASIFGFKQVAQCISNTNGECQFLIELSTKTYRLVGSTVINGITYTATNPLAADTGETFQPTISGGQEVIGQDIVRQLKLKLSSNIATASSVGLSITAPETESDTIISQNDTNTVINIPTSFSADNGLSYTVCLEIYVISGTSFNEVISPICTTGASGVLPTTDITLNNAYDYQARITIDFDNSKTIYQSYNYPNNKSFSQILQSQALVPNMVMFFWVILLSISLYLRNIGLWAWGAMFLAVIQVSLFTNLLVASSSVILILDNAIVLYISKRQVDLQ